MIKINKMAVAKGNPSHYLQILGLLSYIFLATSNTHVNGDFERFKAALCGVPEGNFDIRTLTSQSAWSYKVNKATETDKCLKTTPNASISSCEFSMSFCHPYNCSDTETSLMNTTACITVEDKSGSQTFKLGSYDANVNQFDNDPGDKTSKFVAHFKNGGQYNGTGQNCNLTMDVEFDCQADMIWQSSIKSKADINSKAISSIDFDGHACKYKIKFHYSGACPPKPPVNPSEKLSFGSVLLIIFFIGLTIYFVFGSIVKYCFGSRGKEILPQSEFWTMLPVYIADGFIFTCTCGKSGGDKDSKYDTI